MNKLFSLTSLLLASVLTLSACTKQTAETPSPAASSPTPEASVASPSPSASAEASPSTSPAALAQTYKEKDGLFEISFPAGYKYQETGSGIAFVSGDEKFGGSVDFGSAQGGRLSTKQLEDSLKSEYEKRLETVAWQGSEIQPDGSVRVDWVGRDKEGNDLDAVSFVEQRGDHVFILNLFGVNKAYQDYQADAEAIVGSYHVKQ
ncbi:MAG TPA: hypothetical protein V6C78_01990 [Crinalium sp.]|jgi:hypothetical protein